VCFQDDAFGGDRLREVFLPELVISHHRHSFEKERRRRGGVAFQNCVSM
jgi:hypothetical protein